jgi:predicted RNA-binding Zn-ribbon protein involved in translation (DUF1610 family)
MKYKDNKWKPLKPKPVLSCPQCEQVIRIPQRIKQAVLRLCNKCGWVSDGNNESMRSKQ